MLLNEITTSDEVKIDKINKALKETYGFTLVSEVKSGKLNQLYTKIADDLYDLKLNLNTAQDPAYMQALLVQEGLKMLIAKSNQRLNEAAMLAGRGGRKLELVVNKLADYVFKACDVGDSFETAVADAMRAYELWPYRFDKELVEYELRKITEHECEDTDRFAIESVLEGDDCDVCDDCECDPCECDKVEEGKLPDALKKHQFGAKDDADDSDDSDDSDDTEESDDKEELDEFIAPLAGAVAKGVGAVAKGAGKVAGKAVKAAGKAVGGAVKSYANDKAKDYVLANDPVTSEDINPETGEEYQPGPGMSTRYGDGAPNTRPSPRMVQFDRWWEFDKGAIMSQVYWQKSQLPPRDPEAYDRNWEKVKANLSAKYPAPESGMEELDEIQDRHASREWVRDLSNQKRAKSDPSFDYQAANPDNEPEDFFSYQAKKGKKNEMKEGYVKELRKLLEAEVEQAESLIAAKSFSQELQDMIEKLGRLVNEDLPAVADQMRDSHGADVATGFEDSVSSTLTGIMDSLRGSKQELDNSVATIADGGMPSVGNDMGEFGGEDEFGAEADLDVDVDSDVELDLGDAELGDEFGGADELAGMEDEPLGRAKKESMKIIANKIVETEEKLARIKAKL